MSFFYPDISNHNPGYLIPQGTSVVFAKATEGTSYEDPLYVSFHNQARATGVRLFGGYHWLHSGNINAQVALAYRIVGPGTPLMLDCEDLSVSLTLTDILTFIAQYRAVGGIIHLIYLPRWYWETHMHSVDLTPLMRMNMFLVASDYSHIPSTSFWPAPYGGMTPLVWQFTDNFLGAGVDMNLVNVTLSSFIHMMTGREGRDMFVAQKTEELGDGTTLPIGTVLLCDGMDSIALTLVDYQRLQTLVGEGLVFLTNDVHTPRSGWYNGPGFGRLSIPSAQPTTVLGDVTVTGTLHLGA